MKNAWAVTALTVAALAFFAFVNGLNGEFVFDDRPFLIDNPQLAAPHSLAYFFSENLWYYSNLPDAYSGSYRPLFFLSLWSSNQLGVANPFGLHFANLLAHLSTALLLLLLIRRLIPGVSALAAGIAVGLFAVHPVHTEAVAWVGAFIHPLVTLFLIAAYLSHAHPSRDRRLTRLIAAGTFFILALLSNEMALAFPVLVLLGDRVKFGRFQIIESLPYFGLLAVYLFVRNKVLGETVPLTFSDIDAWLRLPTFLLEYLRHLLIPWPQPLYLHLPADWGISIVAIVTMALFIAVCVWLYRLPAENRRVPLIAAIWIAVFLLPPMAAALSPDARFALRSLYAPSVGVAILLAWVIDTLPALRKPIGLAFWAGLIGLAMFTTVIANRHWQNDGTVYGQIVKWNPSHHAGYIGLGNFYERQNNTGQALAQYEKSVALAEPKDKAEPLELMALLLGKSGDSTRSLELFAELTLLQPDSASAWNGVGNNQWALGQLTYAADAYLKAHEVDPDDRIACYNLVLVLNQLGRSAEAAPYIECSKEKP